MFRSLFPEHLQGSFFALSAYHASAARCEERPLKMVLE
jgi:hypothetical protein